MCRGPLAYGHATATRIHCGVRFGEVFLRVDRGLGHLTEDVFVQRAPHGDRRASPPTRLSERAQGEPREREADQDGPRTIVTACGAAFADVAFASLSVRGGRACARRSRSRGAPRGGLPHRHRARSPPSRGRRRREGTLRPRNRSACALHRSRQPGAARGGRRHPRSRARPRHASCRWSNRRRTHRRGPRRRHHSRRRLGLLHDGRGRVRGGRRGPGRRIGGATRAGRQQRQRVEVPVRLGGQPNSEVDRGHTPLAGTKLGCRNHVPLRDGGAHANGE
jgi:hypothetical protein